MTIRQQLTRIVNILTGSDSAAKNIPGTLGEIADAVENGGGSGGGSNSPFFIEVTFTGTIEGGDLSITVETTTAEFEEALNAGKNIYLRFTNSDNTTTITPLHQYVKEPAEAGSDIMYYGVMFYSNDPNATDPTWVILDNSETTEHATFGVVYMIGDTAIYDYHSGNDSGQL